MFERNDRMNGNERYETNENKCLHFYLKKLLRQRKLETELNGLVIDIVSFLYT